MLAFRTAHRARGASATFAGACAVTLLLSAVAGGQEPSSFCSSDTGSPRPALTTHLTGTRTSRVSCFGNPESVTVGAVYDPQAGSPAPELGAVTLSGDLDTDDGFQRRELSFTPGSAASAGEVAAADVTVVADGQPKVLTVRWQFTAGNEAPQCFAQEGGPLPVAADRDTRLQSVTCMDWENDSLTVAATGQAPGDRLAFDDGTLVYRSSTPGVRTIVLTTTDAYSATSNAIQFSVDVTGPPPAAPAADPAAAAAPAAPVTSAQPAVGAAPTKAQVTRNLRHSLVPVVLRRLARAFASGSAAATIGPFADQTVTTASLTRPGRASRTDSASRSSRLGAGRLSLGAGKKGTLKVALTKAAKKALKKRGKLKATLKVTVSNPVTGAKVTKTKTVTLKAKKTKKKK